METEEKVRELRGFRDQWNAIREEEREAPAQPQKPEMPNPFTGLTAEDARAMAREDAKQLTQLSGGKLPLVLMAVGIVGLLAAGVLVNLSAYAFAALAGAAGLASLFLGVRQYADGKRQTAAIVEKYGTADWKRWTVPIAEYEQAVEDYSEELKNYQEITSDLEVRLMVLRKRRDSLCGAQEPDAVMEFWQQITSKWEAYHTARREAQRAQNLVDTLSAMAKPVRPPVGSDTLTHSPADTVRLLSDCTEEQQRLQSRISQYKGRMEALGDRAQLEKQLSAVNARLAELEKTYTALTIAQETLAQARSELQRRFAPRISQRAQTYLSAMTGGRYQRLSMGEDFSLQAGAGDEETLHDALWRSDGTIDQLYLALRLAVAEELTPDSPLILDDALVRFDDTRMQAALAILEEMAKNRQVILFTCQQREGNAANYGGTSE